MNQDEEIESLLKRLSEQEIDFRKAKERLEEAGFTDVRVVNQDEWETAREG